MSVNKMVPSKSVRSESRRSSILKPRKPRQPLQNVNFDSLSNENSPTTSKIKRRVSFAEKKHVKEFCHSTEQGTVWDNTYEEHDSSLKGSFVIDQNVEVELKKNTSLYASNNDFIHSENNLCYPNNAYLIDNQLSQESITKTSKENDANCDLATLPSESKNIAVSKDAISSNIVVYNDLNKECMELPDEESQSEQIVIRNISKSKSSNIIIYRDSDEESHVNNIATKYSNLCYNNVDSELDKTHIQDLSMDLTAPISASLLPLHLHEEEQKAQGHNKSINNLGANYTTNCNNVSMEMTVPIFAKSVASLNLEISEPILTISQNYENTKWNDVNTHDTVLPTNLQSNIVSKDISEYTSDVKYVNDSMVLTSVIIQPFTNVTGINNTAFDTSMEAIAPSKMDEKKTNDENVCKSYLRKNQTDENEIFDDVLMEMTKPVDTILFSNVCNKENFRVDESVSRDDRITFFHNVSMEMTKTVSAKNKQDINDTITCKSSEKNGCSEKDINIPFNERTKPCKSMELTTLPVSLCQEKTFHAAHVIHSNKNTNEIDKNNTTKFFNDASMEITKSINTAPLNKENLIINESPPKNDKTILFHDVSMEMTTAVPSKNRKKNTQPICKLVPEENTHGEKDRNNSTCFNEGTKLLCKSMEFTEVVPISLHDERTFSTIDTTQSTSFFQTSKTISLPAENSVGVAIQTDILANEINQDISMEITTAVPSTLHLTQDMKVNETENLIISKSNEFQHPMTNNNLKSKKDVEKENFTILENIRDDELSNVLVTQSLLQNPLEDNLDHSLNTNLENASNKKRMSDENEKSCSKRVRKSFVEVQSSQENDIHLFPNTSANNVNDKNDIEDNEYFIKEIMNHTQISDLNLSRDSLNEISKYSFSRKSLSHLENSLVELDSIKPPSFVDLDSEEEKSFEFQLSTVTDTSANNASNRLIINNIPESKCLTNSRENAVNDYVTILKEKEESINNGDNQMEDCHESTIIDKTKANQETDCQAITKTIINDSRFNKSNHITKNINEESILSMNPKDGKAVTVQDINHCISSIIKDIDVIDENQVESQVEREHIQKELSENVELQNIKETKQYLDKKRLETDADKCSVHFEGTGVIQDQINPEEHRENVNDEVKQQNDKVKQKDKCATGRLVTTHTSTIDEDVKNETSTKQDPFLTLLQKLETYAAGEDCIWNVYYKNIDRKMIVFGFIANSLLIATFLSYDFNDTEKDLIKEIKINSRLSDYAGVLIKIVHKLILEKINAKMLVNLYKTHQDILPMLNFISQDVKLAIDFKFDLRRLDDLNLMEIANDEISFVSRSKRMDIILRVTIKVKRFDKLTPNDINCHCLLGRIKEIDIKNLIKNVKKDHKFLRRYMNDVKDYIDIMEETFK